jgi:hypothetical protein
MSKGSSRYKQKIMGIMKDEDLGLFKQFLESTRTPSYRNMDYVCTLVLGLSWLGKHNEIPKLKTTINYLKKKIPVSDVASRCKQVYSVLSNLSRQSENYNDFETPPGYHGVWESILEEIDFDIEKLSSNKECVRKVITQVAGYKVTGVNTTPQRVIEYLQEFFSQQQDEYYQFVFTDILEGNIQPVVKRTESLGQIQTIPEIMFPEH